MTTGRAGAVGVEAVREYLRQQPIPDVGEAATIQPERSVAGERRFRISGPAGVVILKRYEPVALESARREAAGLRLGGEVGLAPTLVRLDEAGGALTGPVVVLQAPRGEVLGHRALTDQEAHGWLFLLLTLHHLPADTVQVPSSMSPDAATWRQRNQAAWDACRAAYTAPEYRPLLDALTMLDAIVTARIEANRALWRQVTRRPCHGNPVPAHLTEAQGRLMLLEWEGFGLGDPAMEVGRAAALAALSGELTADQYVRFVADYLAGVRDLRDADLEQRLQIFASVLPLGFSFVALSLLAQGQTASGDRARDIEQVTRALTWIQDTLGVEAGDPQALLAPLRAAGR
ncbi:MAG: hypothetical protein ABI068_13695 [Ktedonobacterales bacterium]